MKLVFNPFTGKFDWVSVEDLSGYVPYTGATADVDLGSYHLIEGVYDILIDDTTTANMTYVGKADVGSATSSAVWRIARCDITSGTNVITYADGNGNFDNEWDDRASLSYS